MCGGGPLIKLLCFKDESLINMSCSKSTVVVFLIFTFFRHFHNLLENSKTMFMLDAFQKVSLGYVVVFSMPLNGVYKYAAVTPASSQ